jgi:small subunit ribosomal protein S18
MTDEAIRGEEPEEEDAENEEEEEARAEAPAPSSRPRPARRGTDGPPRRGYSRGRFRPRRKVCSFCVDKVTHINYKDVDTIRRFVDDHGKIVPRRKTGTCAKHQRRLASAIKQARHLALLPFVAGRSPYR